MRTLVLAQQEAELAGQGFVDTEHMLLGLLRLGSGSGYKALTNLGIDAKAVRAPIDRSRGTKRSKVTQVIPTSRVKRVIEIAFEQSRRMEKERIRSGHLLMGLALEGEGIAALVLRDLGGTADRVVAEVERELGAPPSGSSTAGKPDRTNQPPMSGNQPAEPPPNVTALRERLASMRMLLKNAAAARDGEHALKLAAEVDRLGNDLDRAEKEWFDWLGGQLR